MQLKYWYCNSKWEVYTIPPKIIFCKDWDLVKQVHICGAYGSQGGRIYVFMKCIYLNCMMLLCHILVLEWVCTLQFLNVKESLIKTSLIFEGNNKTINFKLPSIITNCTISLKSCSEKCLWCKMYYFIY